MKNTRRRSNGARTQAPQGVPAAAPAAPGAAAPRWRFPLRCGGLFLAGCALDALLDFAISASLGQATANLLAASLRAVGQPAMTYGDIVVAGGFSAQIIPECTAVHVLWLYACFVLTMPASVPAKLAGIALGLPALLTVNLLRLMGLMFVGQGLPQHFDLAHHVLAQGVMVLAVVGAASCWQSLSRPGLPGESGTPGMPGGFALRAGGLLLLGVVPWLFGHGLVAAFLDGFANFFASFLGLALEYTPRTTELADPKTLNMLAYAALALAAAAPSHWARLTRLGQGLGVLCAVHVLHRVAALAYKSGGGEISHTVSVAIYFGSQLLAPLLVWFMICRPGVLRGAPFRAAANPATVRES